MRIVIYGILFIVVAFAALVCVVNLDKSEATHDAYELGAILSTWVCIFLYLKVKELTKTTDCNE